MKILSIETSCDETAISIVEVNELNQKTEFKVLSNIVLSQIDIHKKYGGVFPSLAKREHNKNLLPILKQSLEEAKMLDKQKTTVDEDKLDELSRAPELKEETKKFLSSTSKPDIDIIAVTVGPGLAPALWTGVNFANSLSLVWDLPIIGVDHMEGHIFSVLADGEKFNIDKKVFDFPVLSLLISGGHTELVLSEKNLKHVILGSTKDDAVGEAFDKTARLLDLPYPGGPEISRLAKKARSEKLETDIVFPRPMIDSEDLDFSFSGLKTSVLYKTRELGELNQKQKMAIAMEFENAVAEVLSKKTIKALKQSQAKSLIVAGGVSANQFITNKIKEEVDKNDLNKSMLIPNKDLTGDNSVMIALAGYFRFKLKKTHDDLIKANSHFRALK